MELRQFRHLLALTEHGTFHRAAEMLNITQPALSKSIGKLEDIFGAKLLERGRRGVTLTALGEDVCRHARMIFTEIRYAQDAAASARAGEEGEVRVGVAMSLANYLLPNAVARLAEKAPNVRLQVFAGLNDYLFDELRNGHLDLVLSAVPDAPHEKDLVHEVLFTDTVNILARAHHPVAQKSRLELTELLQYPWILFGPGVLSRQHLMAVFLSDRLSPPTPAIESNDATFTKSIVLKSNFLTYLPFEPVRTEFLAGDLVQLNVPGATWQRRVGVTFRRHGSRSPAALRLAEEIRAVTLAWSTPKKRASGRSRHR